MKPIEKGELIEQKQLVNVIHKFEGNPVLELDVTYLIEAKIEFNTNAEFIQTMKVIGKKQDYICSECGQNFIAHKSMCSSCYVRQL